MAVTGEIGESINSELEGSDEDGVEEEEAPEDENEGEDRGEEEEEPHARVVYVED